MIKQSFYYIIVSTIGISTVLSSCTKEIEVNPNFKVKLVDTIISANDSYSTFEYDKQNHVTKYSLFDSSDMIMETAIVTYSGDELTKVDYKNFQPSGSRPYDMLYEFTKNGNKIIVNHTYSNSMYTVQYTSTIYI